MLENKYKGKSFFVFIREFCLGRSMVLLYLLTTISILLTTAISIIQPKIQAEIVDRLSIDGISSFNNLFYLLVPFLGIIIGQYVVNYGKDYLSIIVSENIAEKLRNAVANKMNTINLTSYSKYSFSDILLKCEKNVDIVKDCGVMSIITISSNIILILSVIPIIFYICVPIFIVTISLILVLLIANYFLSKKIAINSERFLHSYNQYVEILSENEINRIPIRMLNAFSYTIDRFMKKNKDYKERSIEQNRLYIFNKFITILIQFLGIAFTWIWGSYEIMRGTMSLGILLAIMSYQNILMGPIVFLTATISNLSSASIALKDLYHFLREENLENKNITISKKIKKIEVKNLSYKFIGKETNLFTNINVEFNSEKNTYILMGESGSGKSTFVKIIAGIIDSYRGEVFINSVSLREIDRKTYWSKITYIGQKSLFFKDTILNNMKVGNQKEDKEILEKSSIVGIKSEIDNIHLNWETVIQKDSSNFSIGQAVRLDLLRGILKESDMFIFDEITSSLDLDNRLKIYDLINELSKDSIVILITHNNEALQYINAQEFIIKQKTLIQKY